MPDAFSPTARIHIYARADRQVRGQRLGRALALPRRAHDLRRAARVAAGRGLSRRRLRGTLRVRQGGDPPDRRGEPAAFGRASRGFRMSFEERLAGAVREAVYKTYGVELNGIHVERPNDPAHGHFATNVALANARVLRRNPREVAENLVEALDAPFVREAEVAGPGFVNFRLSPEALWDEVGSLLREGEPYGRREPSGDPVLLEFVSVNPTGPMHVGHGRQAAFGDSLARILAAVGRNVSREYYFNDGGNQIRLFGESVAVRYAALFGEEWPVSDPDVLYKGDYTERIAEDIAEEH